jgi:RNA-directed DNA polymerase
VTFLARWPAGKARQHARDRIRELTRRSRLLLPVKRIVEDLNGSWAAGRPSSGSATAARFEKVRSYARIRLALLISKRLRRSRPFGWPVVTFKSPDQLGLITLSGIVVAPRPFRDWRGRPNAGGERRR